MKHTNFRTNLALISVGTLTLCGCGGTANTPTTTNTSTPDTTETAPVTPTSSTTATSITSSTSTPTSTDETVLTTTMTPLGEIIVGSNGMTVYYFTSDVKDSNKSSCEGQCLVNWPPVIAESGIPKVEGITATVGTISAADGKRHVTVNGMPIYFWKNDKAKGDVTGQGVQNVWYVVAPDGTMIKTPVPE